ncbi:MAG: TraR/DksA C4-type zinc finger protein [Patescibacteria group bacterium]
MIGAGSLTTEQVKGTGTTQTQTQKGGGEKSYLTQKDLKTIRLKLEDEKKKCIETLEASDETIKEGVTQVHTSGAHDENGSHEIGIETTALGGQRAGVHLKKILAALERIKEKNYDGICISCRKPINKERLKAVPTTRQCITCKNGQH